MTTCIFGFYVHFSFCFLPTIKNKWTFTLTNFPVQWMKIMRYITQLHELSEQPTYISLWMVTMSNDIELNPGPRIPKYPCGSCSKAVRNNQNSIQCDGCGSWHHIECQGMRSEIHDVMANHESYSWSCMKCGLPNFSTTFLIVLSPHLHQQIASVPLMPLTHA